MTSDRWTGVSDEVRRDQIQRMASGARQEYEAVRDLYGDFAESVASVLRVCIQDAGMIVLSVTPRAKTLESFERKAARVNPDDPSRPKYEEPFRQITDKAAVRVITYFLDDVARVSGLVETNFEVLETIDKGDEEPGQVGYASVHLLLRYPGDRIRLPDFRRYSDLIAEVQVRTILQHAWAEIEHDIQYKAEAAVPSRVTQRFNALAGLIQIADREFQAIYNENTNIEKDVRKRVEAGQLEDIELNAVSLRAFLDWRLGPDRHVSPYSYRWMVRILKRLGFRDLSEVEECISGYAIDDVNNRLYKYHQGQMTRFQNVLLAAIGEPFIQAHPQTSADDWSVQDELRQRLDALTREGVELRSFRPSRFREELYYIEES